VIAILVVGCGGTTTSTGPVGSAASSPDASRSAGIASPNPGTSASTETPGGAVALAAGFPDAGTYRTTAFQPQLTVQIDDAWQVLFQDDEDEVALESDSGDGMMFMAWRISRVVGPNGSVIDAPVDLVAWLRGHPSLSAAAPAATTVGSLPATSIDVTNDGTQDRDLFAFPPTGSFHIPPGFRLRLMVVPMDGPDLVIASGGPVDRFGAAMSRTKPMLDSLQISD